MPHFVASHQGFPGLSKYPFTHSQSKKDYLFPSFLLNSLHASGDFCHLLKTFANGVDPDQDRHDAGPDLDPNRLTL